MEPNMDKELFERKRFHDVCNQIYAVDASNQLMKEKVDNIVKDFDDLSVDIKALLKKSAEKEIRMAKLEHQMGVYNKVLWALFSTTLASVAAWIFSH